MAYSLACGDVVPGCQAHFAAETQDELLDQVAAHARDEHGIDEIDPETGAAVQAAIKETD